MSVTQATVTSMPVAVRYRRNVGSLLIDMSTDRYINPDVAVNIATNISVDMSTDTSRSTHRPRVSRYVDWHRSSIGRYVDRHSTDMSVEMSTVYRSRGFVNYTWSKFPLLNMSCYSLGDLFKADETNNSKELQRLRILTGGDNEQIMFKKQIQLMDEVGQKFGTLTSWLNCIPLSHSH